jgi:hypothetical protein
MTTVYHCLNMANEYFIIAVDNHEMTPQISRTESRNLALEPSRQEIEEAAIKDGIELVEFFSSDPDCPHNWSSVGEQTPKLSAFAYNCYS